MTNAVYLGDYTAIAKTIYGYKIYVDTRDVSVAPHILLEGKWEMWIGDALIPFLNKSTFLDIGANVGWYSLLAHQCDAEVIFAFEPLPRLAVLLGRTFSVNGMWRTGVVISQTAVSEEVNSDTDIYVNLVNSGGASLLKQDNTEAVGVTQITLDHLWKSEEVYRIPREKVFDNPIVLKIDVEGYEPRVVLGGQELFKNRDCTAFIEYHADPKGETKLVEMLDFLEQNRYQMSHVGTDSQFHPITREGLSGLPDAEMLCFRRFQV